LSFQSYTMFHCIYIDSAGVVRTICGARSGQGGFVGRHGTPLSVYVLCTANYLLLQNYSDVMFWYMHAAHKGSGIFP